MALRLPHAVMGLLACAFMMAGMTGPRAEGIRPLPVPAVTIPAGHVMTAADLTQRRFQTTRRSLTGIATKTKEIAGKETRRTLPAGRPIPLSALTEPIAVRRGDKAMVSYAEAGFSISASVIVLEDGSAGSMIGARNVETGQIIRAEVLPGGKLVVGPQ